MSKSIKKYDRLDILKRLKKELSKYSVKKYKLTLTEDNHIEIRNKDSTKICHRVYIYWQYLTKLSNISVWSSKDTEYGVREFHYYENNLSEKELQKSIGRIAKEICESNVYNIMI